MSKTTTIQDLFYANNWADYGVHIDYSNYNSSKYINVHIGSYIYAIHFKRLHQAVFSTEHGRHVYYHIVSDIMEKIPDLHLHDIITYFTFNYDIEHLDVFTLCDDLQQYNEMYDAIERLEI